MEQLYFLRSLVAKIVRNQGKKKSDREVVSFRETKIALLLKPILCGEVFSHFICCNKPDPDSVKMTRFTLKFAAHVRRIPVEVTKNMKIDKAQALSTYKQRVAILEKRILTQEE